MRGVGRFGQALVAIQFMEMELKLRMKDFRSGVRSLHKAPSGTVHTRRTGGTGGAADYRWNSWWLLEENQLTAQVCSFSPRWIIHSENRISVSR